MNGKLKEAPISVETRIVAAVLRHLRDTGQKWEDAESTRGNA